MKERYVYVEKDEKMFKIMKKKENKILTQIERRPLKLEAEVFLFLKKKLRLLVCNFKYIQKVKKKQPWGEKEEKKSPKKYCSKR